MKKEASKKGIDRRDFLKGLAAGGAALAAYQMMGNVDSNWAAEAVDIGECKSVRIRCISETSWFDNDQLMGDIMKAGGASTNQYNIKWNHKNSGGYSALVEVEALNGTMRRFILDTGWNPAWMDYSFQREGIDDLLRKKDIEFLYVSHEHMDHFWGLPVTLKYRPDLQIMISNHYFPEGKELVQKSGLKGEVVELGPGKVNKLFPGCASPMIYP